MKNLQKIFEGVSSVKDTLVDSFYRHSPKIMAGSAGLMAGSIAFNHISDSTGIADAIGKAALFSGLAIGAPTVLTRGTRMPTADDVFKVGGIASLATAGTMALAQYVKPFIS